MELKEKYTDDSVEDLLAKLMQSNVMEQIRQHLLTQQMRNSQKAANLLDK